MSMSSEESERIAICCVLLDIVEAMGTSADIKGCRHYQSLRDKTDITDSDFEGARSVSVLSSLVTLKGMHYNKKMLLALTVCDLYSGHTLCLLIKDCIRNIDECNRMADIVF